MTNLSWGNRAEMSDIEALFWRAEVDPRLRSSGVVVDILDRVPCWDRLVEAHEWATRLIPRLRDRVIDDPLRIGPPVWVPAGLDLVYHLTRTTVTAEAGFNRVLDIAAGLHMEAFDPARPLWRAVLVEGLPFGRAAYLLKIHHSMSDGQGVVQLFDIVHGRQSAPTRDKPDAPLVVPTETTPMDIAASRAARLVRSSPAGLARATSGLARTVVRGVTHPQDLASAVAYGSSLARVASPGRTHPSPLLRRRGLSRRLRVMDVPLARVRDAGRATGGTVNDVFLAGLIGGLRLYHEEHAVEVGDLPVALPVSLRSAGDDRGGNRFTAANIAGPAGVADPAERVRLIHRRVAQARAEPALDFMGSAASVASRLPSLVLARVGHRLAQAVDLQASNIPGLQRDSYLAGARIERMYVFGPVPGSAIMATLLSHGDTCCIGVAVDHAAVPDPDTLIEKFEAGMAEVVALGEVCQ